MSVAPAPGPLTFDWVMTAQAQPDAFERYRALISNLYQVTGVAPADIAGFYSRASGLHLGSALMARVWSVAQTFVRSSEEIRRSGYDHFNIMFDIKGHVSADYDGRAVDSRPGNVRFMDTSREMRTTLTGADGFEMINLVVPRGRMPARLRGLDLHGLTLDADTAGVRMLHRHVLGLFDGADSMNTVEANAALEAVFALVEGALKDAPELRAGQTQAARLTARGAAKAYIDASLADGRLDPGDIAAAVGVSRSVLYRIFDSYGGVAAYVLTRRLDLAFEALVRRRGGAPSIGEIGRAHGFGSDAHFSRAFKARFGMSPREAEERPGGPDGSALSFDDGPGVPAMLNWMDML